MRTTVKIYIEFPVHLPTTASEAALVTRVISATCCWVIIVTCLGANCDRFTTARYLPCTIKSRVLILLRIRANISVPYIIDTGSR